jgi:hypothetical protein
MDQPELASRDVNGIEGVSIPYAERVASRIGSTGIVFLVALAISVISWWGVLQPGFPITVDGDLHIARGFHMEHELRNGQFPVRWASEQVWGYGYPTFNFYYPLPYYLAAGLHMVGLPMPVAIEVLIAAGFTIGAISAGLWGRSVWGTAGGIVASAIYTLSPPVLQAAYFFMSFGEVLAIGVLPIGFWALHRAQQSPRRRVLYILTGAMGIGIAVLCHNLIGAMGIAMLSCYGVILCLGSGRRPILDAIAIVLLALGLSAFFWLPGVTELGYTRARAGNISFGPRAALLDPSFGPRSGGSQELTNYAFSRNTLGVASLIAVVVAGTAAVAFRRYLGREHVTHLRFGLLVFGGIVLFLVIPMRLQVWSALPLLDHAQYDARILTLVGLPAALLGGSVTLWTWPRPLLMSLLLGASIIYGIAFARPVVSERADDASFLAFTELMRGAADWDRTVLPVQARFDSPMLEREPAPTLSPSSEGITDYRKRSTHMWVSLDLASPATLSVPAFNFPGWAAWIDGTPVQTEANPTIGTVQVAVPPGRHEVEVRLTNTPVRTAGNGISLLTALGMTGVAIYVVSRMLARTAKPD